MSVDADVDQAVAWTKVYERITSLMRDFGTEDHLGKGDYLIVDDNYGSRRNTIEIHNLRMLRPVIVKSLQNALGDAPNWEIVMAVDIPGTEESWPRMGITIRPNEIVDDLKRQYLPEEFQTLEYYSSTGATS